MTRHIRTSRLSRRSFSTLAALVLVGALLVGSTDEDCTPAPVVPTGDVAEPDPEPPRCEPSRPGYMEPRLAFYQADIADAWYVARDTSLGYAELSFVGAERMHYFNLSVRGQWLVRNLPVNNVEGPGVDQTVAYTFELGVPDGTPVRELPYDFSLTPCVLADMPRVEEDWAIVADRRIAVQPGAPFVEMVGTGSPGDEGTEGGPAEDAEHTHTNSGFPNQESDDRACVPTAVSNSLQFLNEKHDLGIDPDAIDIESMKEATNWGDKGAAGTGAWIDPDESRPEGEQEAWWQSKDNYMQANDLPISTVMTEDFGDALDALDEDCDIEIEMHGHTAAVVGATRLEDGRYSIDIAHDTDQGDEGGTTVETVTLDPATGAITGGTGTGGGFNYLVIECPVEGDAAGGTE